MPGADQQERSDAERGPRPAGHRRARRGSVGGVAPRRVPGGVRADRGREHPDPASTTAGRSGSWGIRLGFAAVFVASLVVAAAPMLERQGASLWDASVARVGAVVGTWCSVVLVTRRIGGPLAIVAGFGALSGAAVLVFERGWVLAAGAAVAAVTFGLLGMVMTRPAAGVRALREVAVTTVCGAAGLIVVSGFAVSVHPYRFRLMVLAATLVGAFAFARRLGLGFASLGRRGAVLIVGAVVVLAVAVAYVQAVRHWGSSDVVGSLGTNGRVRRWLWASPRPIEALVGFPALVWGVVIRNRRRQGWWMTAFGSLAATGIATSLVQPSVTLGPAAAATGYDVAIGSLLGLLLVAADRLITGSGRGSRVARAGVPDRPEPARLDRLI